LSNVIKQPFVEVAENAVEVANFDEELKDTNKDEQINNEENYDLDENKEEPKDSTMIKEDNYYSNGDYRGISKVLMEREKALKQKERNVKIQTEEIIKNAGKKAENIISAAQKQAQIVIEDAQNEGAEAGYSDGLAKGKREAEKFRRQLEKEYQEKKEELLAEQKQFEKDFIDKISVILEKMTNVMVEDNKEVLGHIIEREFADIERSDTYLIKVSAKDYEYVNEKKQMLRGFIKDEASLEIAVTDNLDSNMCIIETDNSVIDCSLDTQLSNLIMDLKLLSRV